MTRLIDVAWQILVIGFIFWLFGAVIPLLGLIGASRVVELFTSVEGAPGQHVFAAMVEPFVTKFFPALAVVVLSSRHRGNLPGLVQRALAGVDFPELDLAVVMGRPFVMGAYGGLAFGVLEAAGKLVKHGFGVTNGLILAACVHVVTGLLVAGCVFWTVGMEREWVRGLVRGIGLGLAISLHLAWNTGLNAVVIQAVSA